MRVILGHLGTKWLAKGGWDGSMQYRLSTCISPTHSSSGMSKFWAWESNRQAGRNVQIGA